MKAVYEELNGEMAVFIVDSINKFYHVPAANLPADAETGDVFEVEICGNHLRLLEKLPEEKKRRLDKNRAKREALLKRKRKRP